MPRKINQPESMSENQTPDNTIQKITTETKSEIGQSIGSCLEKFAADCDEIEQKRVEYLMSKSHKVNDPTLRAINTLRKLEKLPISQIPQISIPFAEGM